MAIHDVVVHKAAITLRPDESLRDYTNALSAKGAEHVRKKRNATPKTSSVWMVEAFADSAIFCMYPYSENGVGGETKHYAVKYTREDSGEFKFGETVEVKQVVRFEAAPAVAVVKSIAAPRTPESVDTEKHLQTFGPNRSWIETGANFWSTTV